MDPLSKNSIYKMTNNQNALIDAFEEAASSFAVSHNIPGATYYKPKNDEKKNEKNILRQSEEKNQTHIQKIDITNQEQDACPQFEDSSSSEQELITLPHQDVQTFNLQEQMKIQAKNKVPNQQPLKKPEHNLTENLKYPVPSETVMYPPPMLDETDPDKIRLLHSWFWAGYYTGLADGKRTANPQ